MTGCTPRDDCEHGQNQTSCDCNDAPVNLCGDSVTRTWWGTCRNGQQKQMQSTHNPCGDSGDEATEVTDSNGNPVTRSCVENNCPSGLILRDNECKCVIDAQSWRPPSACHTQGQYGCRCTDDSLRLSADRTRCEPRCKGGSVFVASNCSCDCTAENSYYNGTRCVTCSPPKTWDLATSTCKCPTGKTERGSLCCSPCENGYASASSCTCQSATVTSVCPRSGEPNLTRQVGSGNTATCHCPNGKHAVGQNPTLCCSRETCPEGKTRAEDSCTCSPTPCTTGLVLCGGVCIEGKDCPGVTEKVCPTEDCPPPRDPQGLPLATPATCEGE